MLLVGAVGLLDLDGFLLGGDDFDGGHELVGDDGDTDEEVDEDQDVGETAGHLVASGQVVSDDDAVLLDGFDAVLDGLGLQVGDEVHVLAVVAVLGKAVLGGEAVLGVGLVELGVGDVLDGPLLDVGVELVAHPEGNDQTSLAHTGGELATWASLILGAVLAFVTNWASWWGH